VHESDGLLLGVGELTSAGAVKPVRVLHADRPGLESYPPERGRPSSPSASSTACTSGIARFLGAAVTRAREGGLVAVALHVRAASDGDSAAGAGAGRRSPRSTSGSTSIAATGVETTVVLAFTRALAAVEPEAFVKDVVLQRLRAREIVVGFNHTFGRGARGNAQLLEELAPRLGFRVDVVLRASSTAAVSSSEIREALRLGDVERAGRYLGRPYAMVERSRPGGPRSSSAFPTAKHSVLIGPFDRHRRLRRDRRGQGGASRGRRQLGVRRPLREPARGQALCSILLATCTTSP